MIIKLIYTNALLVPVLLRSNQGTGQPLMAGQTLEMTFQATDPDEDGVSELILYCETNP